MELSLCPPFFFPSSSSIFFFFLSLGVFNKKHGTHARPSLEQGRGLAVVVIAGRWTDDRTI